MNIRKIFDTGLDVYGHMVFGRMVFWTLVMTIGLLGITAKGVFNAVDMTRTQGINLFEPQFAIGDYKHNCQALIDNDFDVVEIKPYDRWRDSICIDYSKSKVTRMILVLEHQLGARMKLSESFLIYLIAFICFLLYALHATTPSPLVNAPKISAHKLCGIWMVVSILLFPFTFRDHNAGSNFTRDGVEYTAYTVYTAKDGNKFSCPTPFFAKLKETQCDPYTWLK